MDVLALQLDQVERWLLMLFRVGAMVYAMPFFGLIVFPSQVRIGLVIFLTSILFGVIPESTFVVNSFIDVIGLLAREIMVGAAIGLVGQFLFYGIIFSGQVVGHLIGFGIINAMDPQSETQVPIIGQILNNLAIILFLLAGGHHFLLMAMRESFVLIPLGEGIISASSVAGFSRMSADIFAIGVKFAAPVLVTILVMEFALAIVSRTVPQINVWLIGFPLKVGMGLLTLSFTLPFVVFVFGKVYGGWQGDMIDFIVTLAQ